MNTSEISICNGLQQALDNLNTLDVTDLSDELITSLLGLIPRLEQCFIDAKAEAVSRASDGVCYDGYTLREKSRRRIVDEVGAIDALRRVDPELVAICQNRKLASITELQARLGKTRFENIFGPYIEKRTWNWLSRDR